MPIPKPTARIEASFQPILPKVDHILELMREHQARMTDGGKGAEGDVDLEDKIIKEVRRVVSIHLVFDMLISGRKVMLIMNLNLLPCPHNLLSKTAHIYPGTHHVKYLKPAEPSLILPIT
jgi:hypothetical protein